MTRSEIDQRLIYETVLACRALVATGAALTKRARRGLQTTLDSFGALDLLPVEAHPALPPPPVDVVLPSPTTPPTPAATRGAGGNAPLTPAELALDVEEW